MDDKEYEKLLAKFAAMIKKYDKHKTFTTEEKTEILSLICYNNLGYCCGIEKDCQYRDTVLAILKMDKQFYKEVKSAFGEELWNRQMRCKVCGCTEEKACKGGCYWIAPYLCNKCYEKGQKKPKKAS